MSSLGASENAVFGNKAPSGVRASIGALENTVLGNAAFSGLRADVLWQNKLKYNLLEASGEFAISA